METTKISPNEIYFYLNQEIESCDFKVDKDGVYITTGKKYGGTTISCNGKELKITVFAERENSEEVAESFKKNVQGGFVVKGYAFAKMPDKLNFAVKGMLAIKLKNSDEKELHLIIAQGHATEDKVRNNWWIGFVDFGMKDRDKDTHHFDLYIA